MKNETLKKEIDSIKVGLLSSGSFTSDDSDHIKIASSLKGSDLYDDVLDQLYSEVDGALGKYGKVDMNHESVTFYAGASLEFAKGLSESLTGMFAWMRPKVVGGPSRLFKRHLFTNKIDIEVEMDDDIISEEFIMDGLEDDQWMGRASDWLDEQHEIYEGDPEAYKKFKENQREAFEKVTKLARSSNPTIFVDRSYTGYEVRDMSHIEESQRVEVGNYEYYIEPSYSVFLNVL